VGLGWGAKLPDYTEVIATTAYEGIIRATTLHLRPFRGSVGEQAHPTIRKCINVSLNGNQFFGVTQLTGLPCQSVTFLSALLSDTSFNILTRVIQYSDCFFSFQVPPGS
jgi:hypothetical protein